jgi:epsilon-lactone hydrolase
MPAGVENATVTGASALDALIERIREQGWPDDIESARVAFDADGPPLAPDVQLRPLTLAGRPAQRLLAPQADPRRVVLYLHGGGYVYGSLASHQGLCGEISRAAGAAVVQLDYRLAPEHPHPAALDDAVAAFRELAQSTPACDITLMGDSAGGGLVVAALCALRGAGQELPAGAVCLSPWVDLTASSPSYHLRAEADPMITRELALTLAHHYAAGLPLEHPALSPLYADLTGLPPLYVQVGGREVLHDEAQDLVQRACAAGVAARLEPWAEMIHVWHLYFPYLPQAHEAISRVGAFLRRPDNFPSLP